MGIQFRGRALCCHAQDPKFHLQHCIKTSVVRGHPQTGTHPCRKPRFIAWLLRVLKRPVQYSYNVQTVVLSGKALRETGGRFHKQLTTTHCKAQKEFLRGSVKSGSRAGLLNTLFHYYLNTSFFFHILVIQ